MRLKEVFGAWTETRAAELVPQQQGMAVHGIGEERGIGEEEKSGGSGGDDGAAVEAMNPYWKWIGRFSAEGYMDSIERCRGESSFLPFLRFYKRVTLAGLAVRLQN